ncbi:MAG TPA: VCBS repeat-containing protein, partial [Terriglobales bacterium]
MDLSKCAVLLLFSLSASTSYAATFSKKSYPTGNMPAAVVSADINRDGHPDLISADSDGDGFISVLLGASGGAFTISEVFGTAAVPVALAAGDFNHDGYPDVAALEGSGYQVFFSS